MRRSKIINNHSSGGEIQFDGIWAKLFESHPANSADLNFETSPANYGILTKEVIEKYTETIPFEEVIENKQLQ